MESSIFTEFTPIQLLQLRVQKNIYTLVQIAFDDFLIIRFSITRGIAENSRKCCPSMSYTRENKKILAKVLLEPHYRSHDDKSCDQQLGTLATYGGNSQKILWVKGQREGGWILVGVPGKLLFQNLYMSWLMGKRKAPEIFRMWKRVKKCGCRIIAIHYSILERKELARGEEKEKDRTSNRTKVDSANQPSLINCLENYMNQISCTYNILKDN